MAKLKAIENTEEDNSALYADDFNITGSDDDGGIRFEGSCTSGPVLNLDGYFSIDDGVITDEDEILIAKRRATQDVLKELMVGSYEDKNGQYRVSEKIEIELHNIKKIVSKKVGDCYFVSSITDLLGYGSLNFMVQTTIMVNGERRAQLFLTEEIEREAGIAVNTNVFLVSEYLGLADASFIPNMFSAFNILDPVTQMDEIEKYKHEVAEHTLKRKMFLKNMGDAIGPDVELLESQLLEARIDMLKQEGKLGEEILFDFEKRKKRRQKNKKEKEELTAQQLNEMLEASFKDAKVKADKGRLKEIFNKQRKDVVENMKQFEQLKQSKMAESIKQANLDYKKELNKPISQREAEKDLKDQNLKDQNKINNQNKTNPQSEFDRRMKEFWQDKNGNGRPDGLDKLLGNNKTNSERKETNNLPKNTPSPQQERGYRKEYKPENMSKEYNSKKREQLYSPQQTTQEKAVDTVDTDALKKESDETSSKNLEEAIKGGEPQKEANATGQTRPGTSPEARSEIQTRERQPMDLFLKVSKQIIENSKDETHVNLK